MFWLRYVWAEIVRRWGKTVTITLGLAIASAIIIVMISISGALSDAQKTVLNPLENVGTDIMVTRSVGADGQSQLDEATRTELRSENRMSIDLSKLGSPGDAFSADSFQSGTMLTFESATIKKLDSSVVANVVPGLIMNVSHQEGTVPKVTAQFETGGERLQVNTEIAPMTDAERTAYDAARDMAMADLKAKGIDPRSEEGRQAVREATNSALPERFRRTTTEITTPKQIFTKDIGPIATDIKTETFTVSGVDTGNTAMGLILPDQIVNGAYFTGDGTGQVVINKAFADKQRKKVGDTVKLNSVEYKVVGIVNPKLYTNTTDYYLPLPELQKIAGKENRINIMLIKSGSASSVEDTSKKLEGLFSGAKVVNSKDTAKQVTGSLVSVSNLTDRFIGLTSLIVVLAAFIIVSLLTVSSINKRTREIGTLKAIGWSNAEVLRQIVAENVVLGVLGALAGVGLGVGALLLMNRYDVSLSANISSLNTTATGMFRGFPGGGGFGVRGDEAQAAASSVETVVHLKASLSYLVILLGVAVAIGGAVVSGFFAALKASVMRPQAALRNLE